MTLSLYLPIATSREFETLLYNLPSLQILKKKMRCKEEVEKMFEATKKEVEKIVEADTPRTGLQEDKRLMLSAQLGILSWVLDIEK